MSSKVSSERIIQSAVYNSNTHNNNYHRHHHHTAAGIDYSSSPCNTKSILTQRVCNTLPIAIISSSSLTENHNNLDNNCRKKQDQTNNCVDCCNIHPSSSVVVVVPIVDTTMEPICVDHSTSTKLYNPASAALISQSSSHSLYGKKLLCKPHHETVGYNCNNSLEQWNNLFETESCNDNDDVGDSSNVSSSLESASNSDDDDNESDDESVSPSDDEEETHVALALVKAAYNGMTMSEVNRLLGMSPQVLKRTLEMCKPSTGTSSGDVNDSSLHPSSNKKIRGSITAESCMNTTSSTTTANTITTTTTPIPIVTKEKRNPVRYTIQQRRAMMCTSMSAPALRFTCEDSIVRLKQKSSMGVTNAEQQWKDCKPDDCLKSILLNASLPEPKHVIYTSIPHFFIPMIPESIEQYDISLVQAVRTEDINLLRSMYESGTSMHCGNKFGETILHAAARRRSIRVVTFLIKECNVPTNVCCDYGRTPLHDACWTAETNFDVVDLLLDTCPDLLYITDKRGFTPLAYVRKEQWTQWNHYLQMRRTPTSLLAKQLL